MARSASRPMALWCRLPRPLRFLVVGAVNTLFGYGAYALLLGAGMGYAAAALVATIAGIAFNYVTTGGLVFRHMSSSTLRRFVVCYTTTYAINVLGLWALGRVGVDAYRAGLVLILPMAVVSYLAMSHFVFGARRAAH